MQQPPDKIELWNKIAEPYRGPQTRRSVVQLSITAGAFFLLWWATLWSLDVSYLLTLALSVPTAGFVVRLFMIQHDIGHGSYFKSLRVSNFIGYCLGILTIIPYGYWRRTHAYHHAHSGDLQFRGIGDVDTMTVKEYLALSPRGRLIYRLHRNPFIIFVIGPFYQFIIKYRYPLDLPRDWKQAWASVWWTNLGMAALIGLMGFTIGFKQFFLVQTPVTLVACSAGIWLFYVQHQFEETYWKWHNGWDYYDASLEGSSHLMLPKPLQWITASIGLHHVHHLNSMIPNYRLEECLNANPELQQATRLTMGDTWRLFTRTLWDEDKQRLIRFRDVRI